MAEKQTLFLDCFQMQSPAPKLVPGKARREWMDNSPDRFAYRCLPLTMANSTGWDLLCPFDVEIEWTGGDLVEDVIITSPVAGAPVHTLALSHFRAGIVTFHTGHLFRTPPGWAVWCMGPPNQPKDGIYPLSGLVETDWLPFPFTMNWKMTRPGKVTFKKGESFCFFTLIEHHKLESVQPRLRHISSDAELQEDYRQWNISRSEFIKKLNAKDPDTVATGWQRHYMRGEPPSGANISAEHKTKRRLKAPK